MLMFVNALNHMLWPSIFIWLSLHYHKAMLSA